MNKHHILFHTLEILLITLGLTACGGDNEETPQTPNQSITIRIGTATVEGPMQPLLAELSVPPTEQKSMHVDSYTLQNPPYRKTNP